MTNYLLGSEEAECVALAEYLEMLKAQGLVKVYSHTAQETYTTSWKQKSKNKRMGVKSGVPDYIIVTKDKVIFLEMKRKKGGTLSATQREWLANTAGKKTQSVRCNGFDHAKSYLELEIAELAVRNSLSKYAPAYKELSKV